MTDISRGLPPPNSGFPNEVPFFALAFQVFAFVIETSVGLNSALIVGPPSIASSAFV